MKGGRLGEGNVCGLGSEVVKWKKSVYNIAVISSNDCSTDKRPRLNYRL